MTRAGERKDEVGEGEAIPLGVVELTIDVGRVAGIVDQDHEGDGDAAKDIDGEDAWGGDLHGDHPLDRSCRTASSALSFCWNTASSTRSCRARI